MGMHFRAAELFFCCDLTRCGFQQGRTGEECFAATFDGDHIIRKARHISAASGGRPMQDANHRQALLAESRKIGEQRAAGNKPFDGVIHKVAAGAFNEMDERQVLLQRNLLRAFQSITAGDGHGASLDAAVIGDNDAAHAVDKTNRPT